MLHRTPRIHSLTLDQSGSMLLVRQSIEDIYSGIIQCVARSKLRHLDILVPDIYQVEVLLDTFLNLYSIRFCFHGESIWIDLRVKTTNASQRLERSHLSKDASILSLTDPSDTNSSFVRLLQNTVTFFKERFHCKNLLSSRSDRSVTVEWCCSWAHASPRSLMRHCSLFAMAVSLPHLLRKTS